MQKLEPDEFDEFSNLNSDQRIFAEELEALERREMFIYDQQGALVLGQREARQEEKRAIARQLLALLDDDAIARTRGLSVEEIRNLRSASRSNLPGWNNS